MPEIRIHHGDVAERLAALPAEHYHAIVTSPPYHGLRAYLDLPPVVWGGDPDCSHEWADALPRPGNEYREGLGEHSEFKGRQDKAAIRRTLNCGASLRSTLATDPATAAKTIALREMSGNVSGGTFCRLCGAWRGHLGIEPEVDCLAWARGEDPCPACYVCHIRAIWGGKDRPVGLWRVLRADGICWLNIGDSFGGTGTGSGTGNFALKDNPLALKPDRSRITHYASRIKPSELCLVPQRLALALQADGWYVRTEGIWFKRSCMPESTRKRPTRAHEQVWMLTKSPSSRHFFDAEAVKQAPSPHTREYKGSPPGARGRGCPASAMNMRAYMPSNIVSSRNLRTVWRLKPEPSNYDYCGGCGTLWAGSDRKAIRRLHYDAMGEWLVAVDGRCPEEVHLLLGARPEGELRPNWRRLRERNPYESRTWPICPHCGGWDAWIAHYAAFPSDLPRRCLLASTSARGCCPTCGAPWERVVETIGDPRAFGREQAEGQSSAGSHRTIAGVVPSYKVPSSTPLGWQPTCGCGSEPVACRVLDPFSGTGTTLIVAARLGLDGDGIDASAPYVALSRERIRIEGGVGEASLPPRGAMPLFSRVTRHASRVTEEEHSDAST